MKIYTHYISKKIATSFLYTIFAILFVVWLTRSNDILQLIISNGIALSNFFSFSLLIFPEILFYIIPVALFISTISVYIRLRQTSEIFALKNAGLANYDLAKPVLVVAIFVTILHLFISIYIAPLAKRTVTRKIQRFNEQIGSFMIEDRVFIHPTGNITIYAEKRDKLGMLSNIFVNDQRDKSQNTIMFADKGKFVVIDDRTYLNLYHGKRQVLTPTSHGVIDFDYFAVNIDIQKNDPKPHKKLISEMGIFELIKTHQENDSNLIELYNRVSMPALNIILSILSVVMIFKFYRSSHSGLWIIATYLINFSIIISFVFLTRMSLDNHNYAYLSFIILAIISIITLRNFIKE